MTPLPISNAERIYAESNKYGANLLMLIPLPSGAWAIMGADRKIVGVHLSTTFLGQLEVPKIAVTRIEPRRELIPLPDPDLATEFEL